jgi:hypothetical protein
MFRGVDRMAHTFDVRVLSGWQAFVALLVAAVVALILVVTAIWVFALLALLGLFVWFDLVVVPRAASRLGVHRTVLEALLGVALIGGGWWIAGATGGVVGGLLWLASVGVPRLSQSWLQSHVRMTVVGRPEPPVPMLNLVPCPECGVASADVGERCPACGAAMNGAPPRRLAQ